MTGDAQGYYARLNLSPSASDAEIKAAYRRLAKEHHPDTRNAADGGARFRSISEAYAVLGDPVSRARYDAASATAQATARDHRAQISPISCTRCGQATAQPRHVVFRHVVSFVVGTVRSPVQGIFCARCARGAALRATALSAVAGWWGIPWGPIWTVVEGVRNAFGGVSTPAANDRLLWHNAVAFALRGDERLSLHLADKVRRSEDRQLASDAAKLIDHLAGHGVKPGGVALKDPWRLSLGRVLPHLALLAAAPAAAAMVLAGGGGNSSAGTTSEAALTGFSPRPFLPASTPDPMPPTIADPAPAEPPPASTCRRLPANGQILAGRHLLAGKGHALEINNGATGDAIVKLRYAGSMRLAASFFVGSNQSATLSGIPDGTYVVQYALGQALATNCRDFSAMYAAGQFPDPETLTTETVEDMFGTRRRWSRLTYTLYGVPGGNVHPNELDAASFEAS